MKKMNTELFLRISKVREGLESGRKAVANPCLSAFVNLHLRLNFLSVKLVEQDV